MSHPPRIIGYEGLDTAQILEHFDEELLEQLRGLFELTFVESRDGTREPLVVADVHPTTIPRTSLPRRAFVPR